MDVSWSFNLPLLLKKHSIPISCPPYDSSSFGDFIHDVTLTLGFLLPPDSRTGNIDSKQSCALQTIQRSITTMKFDEEVISQRRNAFDRYEPLAALTNVCLTSLTASYFLQVQSISDRPAWICISKCVRPTGCQCLFPTPDTPTLDGGRTGNILDTFLQQVTLIFLRARLSRLLGALE